MTVQLAERTIDQPNENQSPELQQKLAEIRALLPHLESLMAAFADLHELLDAEDLAGNFEEWCERHFGVNPEMLREATDRS